MTRDQCVFIRGFRVKDDKMQVIRVSCVPESSIKNQSPQRSPYRHPTLQRNDCSGDASRTTTLGDNSHIGGSSSNLDTIRPPINHENPQLLPYPSSTVLQSNGNLCNASFMTSPSYDTFFEFPNYIAEAQNIRYEDAFAEDTRIITHDNDLRLPLVDNANESVTHAEDSLRKNIANRNNPAILRVPPETNQMNTERKEGKSRRGMVLRFFRLGVLRLFRRFTSLLGIKNRPTLPTPIPGTAMSAVQHVKFESAALLQPHNDGRRGMPSRQHSPSRMARIQRNRLVSVDLTALRSAPSNLSLRRIWSAPPAMNGSGLPRTNLSAPSDSSGRRNRTVSMPVHRGGHQRVATKPITGPTPQRLQIQNPRRRKARLWQVLTHQNYFQSGYVAVTN
ncbi:hypothetical protein BGY98DRAFT_737942 [Russula aff. rugulosa BPL654]|nr:hypothetical protein BGY98DRAFT_737942 [Russula aff. rugulosa BPL654]